VSISFASHAALAQHEHSTSELEVFVAAEGLAGHGQPHPRGDDPWFDADVILARVVTSARRARNVVQKILTFSHVLGDTSLAPTDLRSVVSERINLFSALAPPSIKIRTEIDTDIPLVRADAALAGDFIVNLCTIAYQAMQGRNGILTVRLRHSPPHVELSVTDTGHGRRRRLTVDSSKKRGGIRTRPDKVAEPRSRACLRNYSRLE
jgi:signal transduction histidine kinase